MVSIAPGYTWSDVSTDSNNTVNGSNLTTLVAGAKVSAIARASIDEDSKIWSVAASAPASPEDHDFWFDTTTSMTRRWDGSVWAAFGKGQTLTNNMSVTLTNGEIVIPDGIMGCTIAPIDAENVLGAAQEHIPPGEAGVIQTMGYGLCRRSTGIGVGQYLIASSTATGLAAVGGSYPTLLVSFGWATETKTGTGLFTAFFMK